jgi:hypothetical protein
MESKLSYRISQSIQNLGQKITLEKGLNFFTTFEHGRYILTCWRDIKTGPSLQEAKTMAAHVEKAIPEISGVEIVKGEREAKNKRGTFEVYELRWSKKVRLL